MFAQVRLFHVGNLTENREIFASAAVNTDDMPVIEYLSPIAQREQAAQRQPWFTGFPLADFQAELSRRLPPERDPYLARLQPEERRFATAGLDLFRTVLNKRRENVEAARESAEAFASKVPPELYRMFKGDVEGRALSPKKDSP